MGLKIKPNFQVRKIDCIDMLGFKISQTHTEIRGRTFLRVRRAFRKAAKRITRVLAKKCLSYLGYLKHTNSKRLQKKLKAIEILQKCKEVTRHESKIFGEAAAG